MKPGTFARLPGAAILVALLLMLPLPASATQLAVEAASPAAPQDVVWTHYSADETINVGTDTSLALDNKNIPFISYYDRSSVGNGHLKYARWAGCEWDTQTVDGNRNVGMYTSLRLDAQNIPHISYHDAYNLDLKYATLQDGRWVLQVVDSAGVVGLHTSLDLDAAGHPHISYYDSTNGQIKYAQWDGSQWVKDVVGPAGTSGGDTSLHLDSTGNAHISYQRADISGADGYLMYAHWNGADWAIEQVDSSGNSGGDTSLALDDDGYPHISYYAVSVSDDGMLRYAYKNVGGWQFEDVDGGVGENVGLYTSLELDVMGRSHVSYLDLGLEYGQRTLLYALRSGANAWSIVPVDPDSSDVGGFSSLALQTAEGNIIPHISYHDYNNDSLKFAIGAGAVLPVTGPAEYTVDKTVGVAPLTVTFTDTSRNLIEEWVWDFGNGSTWTWNTGDGDLADRHPPSQTYTVPGTYTVTLSVSGPGGTNVETAPSPITVYEQVQAAFSADVTSGVTPLAVQFTNGSTGDFDTLAWDFGDGSTSSDANPAHTYTTPGVYAVELTASGLGGTDTELKTGFISVTAPPQPPQAAFTAVPAFGQPPLLVQFTNTSTGEFTTSEWDFGDGSPASTEMNPSHTYTMEGSYDVTLTVRNGSDSSTVTRSNVVSVGRLNIYLPCTLRGQ